LTVTIAVFACAISICTFGRRLAITGDHGSSRASGETLIEGQRDVGPGETLDVVQSNDLR